MYLISDNALSVFGRYYTNEQIYLSFQKMKYQKFVLDCHLKKMIDSRQVSIICRFISITEKQRLQDIIILV